MDAVAVAIGMGLSIHTLRIQHGLIIGLFFGFFQSIMPVIGWAAGRSFQSVMMTADHWIAFALLTIIGLKMIYESIKIKSEEDDVKSLTIYSLFTLSVATSIDAFAIGISFAMLEMSIVTPIIIIGCITFILSFLGVGFGKHVGKLLPKKIEIVGGIVLIAIGIKILIEHVGNF